MNDDGDFQRRATATLIRCARTDTGVRNGLRHDRQDHHHRVPGRHRLNLGAGLYYMMTDKRGSDRMVKALTRRIGLSVLLIVLIPIGRHGVIQPHGVGG